jgi:predicted kinase
MKRKEEREVLLTIGMPGSGKTTWADEFIGKNNAEWMRVSRDHFRFMLSNYGQLEVREESMITDLVTYTARRALMLGYNVLIEATHLSIGHVEQQIDALKDLATIKYRYFDTPYEVCLERDTKRPWNKKVGEEGMKKNKEMHDNFVSSFHFQPVKKQSRTVINYTHGFDMNLPTAVIVDVDGTLAHINNNRGAYEMKKVGKDDPDWPTIELVRALSKQGYSIIVCTGRDESCRNETEEWLDAAEVPRDMVLMRKENDERRDAVVKLELFEEHIKGKYNVLAAVDDRDQVVSLWRELGIKCYQAEDGTF